MEIFRGQCRRRCKVVMNAEIVRTISGAKYRGTPLSSECQACWRLRAFVSRDSSTVESTEFFEFPRTICFPAAPWRLVAFRALAGSPLRKKICASNHRELWDLLKTFRVSQKGNWTIMCGLCGIGCRPVWLLSFCSNEIDELRSTPIEATSKNNL